MKTTIKLLRQCEAQFLYYAQQHLAKVPALQEELRMANGRVDVNSPAAVIRATDLLETTRKKYEVNLRLAEQIADHLQDIEDSAVRPSEEYLPKPIKE